MSEHLDPLKAVDFIYRTAPQYAQAKANRIHLEEFRKSQKAILMKQSGEAAVNAQEREAYAHPKYIELLEGLRLAVEQEEALRWQMVAAEMKVEIFRTVSANNRMLDKAAT